jgi:hypothetical protein
MEGDRDMMKKIIAAFAGAAAGLAVLFAPAAQGATTADDCLRVAKDARPLCYKVKAQHAYGAAYTDGNTYWSVPGGRALVHEITHQGYSQWEMKDALRAAAAEYRDWVTAVPVNMDAIVKKCGNTDGQWVVSFKDEDGKPGGVKLTYKRIVCA